MAKLTTEQQRVIVQGLACFMGPKEVQDELRDRFEIETTISQIVYYDPGSAGTDLSDEWRDVFTQTRARFISDTASIAISHKAVQLRVLDRTIRKVETQKNYGLVGELVEKAAKVSGDAYTNRRILSGPNGGPIPISDETRAEKTADLLARAAARRRAALAVQPKPEPVPAGKKAARRRPAKKVGKR